MKAMTYTIVKNFFKYPKGRYYKIIKHGYKDCDLDQKYLKKALNNN